MPLDMSILSIALLSVLWMDLQCLAAECNDCCESAGFNTTFNGNCRDPKHNYE